MDPSHPHTPTPAVSLGVQAARGLSMGPTLVCMRRLSRDSSCYVLEFLEFLRLPSVCFINLTHIEHQVSTYMDIASIIQCSKAANVHYDVVHTKITTCYLKYYAGDMKGVITLHGFASKSMNRECTNMTYVVQSEQALHQRSTALLWTALR